MTIVTSNLTAEKHDFGHLALARLFWPVEEIEN
jgi:hypothetical protein